MAIQKTWINFFRLLIVYLMIFFIAPLMAAETQSGPDFLIIGFMKSGTTQLAHFLSQHPNIGISPKERRFFTQHFNKGPIWYHNRLCRRTEQILAVGEVSPAYICDERVPARVFSMYPQVKLIIILRNPTDRTYSQYQMRVRHQREPLLFEEALTLEAQGLSPLYHPYVSTSVYIKHLQRWIFLFQRNQMLIIFNEDLKNDPINTLNKICCFLEVPLFTKMPTEDLSLIKKYPPMNAETRQYLDDFFLAYDLELEKLLDVPLSWRKTND